jgi:phosphate uptake regulator
MLQKVWILCKEDLELAKAVCEYDDVVDDLFDSVRRNLITAIREKHGKWEKIIFINDSEVFLNVLVIMQ